MFIATAESKPNMTPIVRTIIHPATIKPALDPWEPELKRYKLDESLPLTTIAPIQTPTKDQRIL